MKIEVRTQTDGDICIAVSGRGGDEKQPVKFAYLSFHISAKQADLLTEKIDRAIRELAARKAVRS